MELNERQQKIVRAVFEELIYRCDKVHYMFGSETIEEMADIARRIRHEPYCKRHGIKYEDMTDDDFLREYDEEYDDQFIDEE